MTEVEMITSRLREAIIDSGYSLSQITAMTGIPKSTLQRWTSGQIKKIPIDEIVIIADAIGVSSKWIMGWEDELHSCTKKLPPPLTAEEVKLLGYYKTLNEEGREKLLDYAEDLAASGRYAPLKVAARTGHTISTLPDDPDSFPDAPDTI